jgi:hypothetical protein
LREGSKLQADSIDRAYLVTDEARALRLAMAAVIPGRHFEQTEWNVTNAWARRSRSACRLVRRLGFMFGNLDPTYPGCGIVRQHFPDPREEVRA